MPDFVLITETASGDKKAYGPTDAANARQLGVEKRTAFEQDPKDSYNEISVDVLPLEPVNAPPTPTIQAA